MAFSFNNNAGQVQFLPQSMNVQEYDNYNGPVQNKAISDPSSMSSYAEQWADSSNGKFSANDAKYYLATKTAQERFKDVDGVDDKRMKQEIDDIYENELGATNTGRDQRGENSVTDFFNTAKGVIDFINNGIGSGLDWMFDNTVGNLAGLADEEWGNNLKNAFSGEDLSIVPDIAEDVLLSLIPYAGIPLVVAKNGIQQADNLTEAFSGKDNITQENLDGWQQAGKMGEALLGIGLSAIPAVGAAKNVGDYKKVLDKTVAENLDSTIAKNAEKDLLADSEFVGDLISPKNLQTVEPPKSADVKLKDLTLQTPNMPSQTIAIPENINSMPVPKGLKVPLQTVEAPQNVSMFGPAVNVPKQAIDNVIAGNKDLLTKEAKKELKRSLSPGYISQVKDSWNTMKSLLKPTRVDGKELDKINAKIDKQKLKKKEAKKNKDSAKAAKAQEKIEKLKEQRGDWAVHPIQAARTMSEGLLPRSNSENYAKFTEMFSEPTKAGKIGERIDNIPIVGGMLRYAGDVGRGGAMAAGAAATAEMGETGVDPITALGQSLGRFATDPGAYGAMLVPLGARKLATSKAPTITGSHSSRLPYQMLRAGAVTDRISDMAQSDIYSSYNEDEMFDRLRAAIDRNNNGV